MDLKNEKQFKFRDEIKNSSRRESISEMVLHCFKENHERILRTRLAERLLCQEKDRIVIALS